jgi:hypothetical protein
MLPSSTDSSIIHGIEDSTMYGLHTITDIRKCPRDDDTHRIVEITCFHLIDDIAILISCIVHPLHNKSIFWREIWDIGVVWREGIESHREMRKEYDQYKKNPPFCKSKTLMKMRVFEVFFAD